MISRVEIGRRFFLGAAAAALALGLAIPAIAQDALKVAGIWTVPVEQQWVSRLHGALVAAQERGEMEYV